MANKNTGNLPSNNWQRAPIEESKSSRPIILNGTILNQHLEKFYQFSVNKKPTKRVYRRKNAAQISKTIVRENQGSFKDIKKEEPQETMLDNTLFQDLPAQTINAFGGQKKLKCLTNNSNLKIKKIGRNNQNSLAAAILNQKVDSKDILLLNTTVKNENINLELFGENSTSETNIDIFQEVKNTEFIIKEEEEDNPSTEAKISHTKKIVNISLDKSTTTKKPLLKKTNQNDPYKLKYIHIPKNSTNLLTKPKKEKTCKVCNVQFDNYGQYKNHRKKNNKCNVILKNWQKTCDGCNLLFDSNKSLQKHIKVIGCKKVYTLQESRTGSNFEIYTEDMKLKNLMCPVCKLKLDSIELLRVHLKESNCKSIYIKRKKGDTTETLDNVEAGNISNVETSKILNVEKFDAASSTLTTLPSFEEAKNFELILKDEEDLTGNNVLPNLEAQDNKETVLLINPDTETNFTDCDTLIENNAEFNHSKILTQSLEYIDVPFLDNINEDNDTLMVGNDLRDVITNKSLKNHIEVIGCKKLSTLNESKIGNKNLNFKRYTEDNMKLKNLKCPVCTLKLDRIELLRQHLKDSNCKSMYIKRKYGHTTEILDSVETSNITNVETSKIPNVEKSDCVANTFATFEEAKNFEFIIKDDEDLTADNVLPDLNIKETRQDIAEVDTLIKSETEDHFTDFDNEIQDNEFDESHILMEPLEVIDDSLLQSNEKDNDINMVGNDFNDFITKNEEFIIKEDLTEDINLDDLFLQVTNQLSSLNVVTKENFKNDKQTYKSKTKKTNIEKTHPRVCNICNLRFRNIINLKAHARKTGCKVTYKCLICSAKYQKFTEHQQHIHETHYKTPSFRTCDICKLKFKNFVLLKQHRKAGECRSVYISKMCEKSLEKIFNADKNTNVEKNEKSSVGTDIKITSNLKKGIVQVVSKKEMYPLPINLLKCQPSENGKTSYVFQKCNADYTNLKHARDHVAKHTEEALEAIQKTTATSQNTNEEVLKNNQSLNNILNHKRPVITYIRVKTNANSTKVGKDTTSVNNAQDNVTTNVSIDYVPPNEEISHHYNENSAKKADSFPCPTCRETFNDIQFLDLHIEHNKNCIPMIYTCHLCKKRFESKLNNYRNYKSHLVQHTMIYLEKKAKMASKKQSKTKPHVSIDYVDSGKSKISYHYNENLSQKGQVMPCPTCHEMFDDIQFLNRHIEHSQTCKPMIYHCHICGKTFNYELYNYRKYKRHVLRHAKKKLEKKPVVKTHKCTFGSCDKVFAKAYRLKCHLGAHQRALDRMPQCRKCKGKFTHKALRIHYRESSCKRKLPDPIPCEICSKLFPCLTQLRKHFQIDHNTDYYYKCSLDSCPYKAKCSASFRRHVKDHHKDHYYKIFKKSCKTCGFVFDSDSSMEKHYQENKACQPKMYQCEKCNKKFAFNILEKLHKCAQLSFTCTICDHTVKTKGNLEKHMMTRHLKPAPRFFCDICGKGFYYPYLLETHRQMTHFDGIYKNVLIRKHPTENICKICKVNCKFPHNLKRHIKRVHPEELQNFIKEFKSAPSSKNLNSNKKKKKFLCSFCGKCLSSMNNLRDHIAIHEGEKKYSCPQCPKKFRFSSALTYHKNVAHKTNLPYKCNICNKEFALMNRYKYHVGRHAGNHVTCNICNKKFANKYNLAYHLKLHKSDKFIPCLYCDKFFYDERGRRKHCKVYHKDEINNESSNVN